MKKFILNTVLFFTFCEAIQAQVPYSSPYDMFIPKNELSQSNSKGAWIYHFSNTDNDTSKVEYNKSNYVAIFYGKQDSIKQTDLQPLKIVKWGVDPLADHPKQIGKSPYSAFWGNPVYFTDPDGRCPDCPDDVYVPIADHVYTKDLAVGMKTSNGWEVSRIDMDDNTGYRGALYQGTFNGKTEYIYATQGTNPTSIKDWVNNAQQAFGNSPQYNQSVEYAQQYADQYSGVSFTGHSLGGGLASANALATEGKAITFNAAGLSNATKTSLNLTGNTANISAYVVQREAVSHYQSMIGLKAEGNITTLPATYAPQIPFTKVDDAYRVYQRVQNHMMEAVIQRFPATR
jgi:hypothetical protein